MQYLCSQVSVVGLDIATVEKICIEASAKVIDRLDLIYIHIYSV